MVNKILAMLKMTPYLGAMAVLSVSSLTYASLNSDFLNSTTGYNSDNRNDILTNRDLRLDVNNDSILRNPFVFDTITGENRVSRNTEVNDQISGDANVDVSFSNELNNAGLDFGLFGVGDNITGTGDFSGGNRITGPNSENLNTVDNRQRLTADIENRARINNDYRLKAITGRNRVTENTVAGDIQTGNVDFSVDVTNDVNRNAQTLDLGLLNSGIVTSDAFNSTTGPNSRNINRVDTSSDVRIIENNQADINTRVDAVANTGENVVSENTLVGDVTTGDVNVRVTGINTAN